MVSKMIPKDIFKFGYEIQCYTDEGIRLLNKLLEPIGLKLVATKPEDVRKMLLSRDSP